MSRGRRPAEASVPVAERAPSREAAASSRRADALEILASALVAVLLAELSGAPRPTSGQLSAQHAKGAPNV